MKSIQTKLTVAILTIFLMALCTLGGLNYWKARQVITQTITSDMEKMAVNTAEELGAWLQARQTELIIMSVSPEVQRGNKETIVPFLENAVKTNKEYDSMTYVDTKGDYINSAKITGNVADRPYFQQAMQGKLAIFGPIISKANGRVVTLFAVPVKVEGKITGILTGAIDMEGLTSKVLSTKVGQTGFAFVVQQDGLTIIHPDKEVAMKVNPLKDANTDPGRKASTEKMVRAEKGITTLQTLGVDRYIAYAPIPIANWEMALTVPVAEVTDTISSLTTISVFTICIVLIITGLLIVWYARRIAKPIQVLDKAAKRIADGDISEVRLGIISNDEIGRLGKSFEQMAENLGSLIRKITEASEQVAASSEELSASAEQSAQASNQVAQVIVGMASGAEKQMKAVDDTASIINQMTQGVQQIAANANIVSGTSEKSANSAQKGSQAIEKAISQMGNIEKTVNRSAQVVANLGERSKQIGQIVDTISSIAGQTNLLALNAAIEAARAGAQGRGFAVVADEVRKLAEQSQDAAKQIAELITEIQKDTANAVVAMDDGTKEVRIGAEVVNGAGHAFQEIFSSINDVSVQTREISAAIQQMASGSQQVVGAVREIEAISKEASGQAQTVSAATEEQSATMEEIAGSSHALAKMATELTETVSNFKV